MMGRPRKYGKLMDLLEDQVLYSPGAIALLARDKGHLSSDDKKCLRQRRRIRHTLARFAKNHHFPPAHGAVKIRGQRETDGWTGFHWKQTYGRTGEVSS